MQKENRVSGAGTLSGRRYVWSGRRFGGADTVDATDSPAQAAYDAEADFLKGEESKKIQHNKYYVVQDSFAPQDCNHLTTCFMGFQPEFFTKILIKREKSQN